MALIRSNSSTTSILSDLSSPKPAAVSAEFMLSESVHMTVLVLPYTGPSILFALSLYQDNKIKFELHLKGQSQELHEFLQFDYVLEWLKSRKETKAIQIVNVIEKHRKNKLPNIETPIATATAGDIATFFDRLTLTHDHARSQNEANIVKLCQTKYLRYLRNILTLKPNVKWQEVDNRILVARIKMLVALDQFQNLAPCLVDKIIDEINCPADLKIELSDDDKVELLNLIELVDITSRPDLNTAFKQAKIKVSINGCTPHADSVIIRKGP